MTQYKVIANGTDMGTFEAGSEAEALEAYARDAGYDSYAEALEVTGDTHETSGVEVVEA